MFQDPLGSPGIAVVTGAVSAFRLQEHGEPISPRIPTRI